MGWGEIFFFDGEDLYWKIDPCKRSQKGCVAGFTDSRGYRRVKFKQKAYFVHRIIYEIYHGNIPDGYEVDHIDRNPSNNRIENLRLATPSQNACNRGLFSNSSTGLKGVSLHKQTGKYSSGIRSGGKRTHLGLYTTKEEAFEAYKEAAKNYHQDFANMEEV
jgi:hypothetical protein